MSILTIILLVLGVFGLVGIGTATFVFLVGKRLLTSWKKPYERATASFSRVAGERGGFFQEFAQQPLLYQWLRDEAVKEPATLTAIFCAADEGARERIFTSLSRPEQKRLHAMVKQKKKFVPQELEAARDTLQHYLEETYRHSARRLGLPFYKLYFYEEYAAPLQTIHSYKKALQPSLQETVEDVVASALHSIPYYKEHRLYEQQHKFEVFLTKDLPAMLTLISNLPPLQRQEKEQELTVFLQEFQNEMNGVQQALERDLQLKMRAAKEKFQAN